MSVQAIAWVLENSESNGASRLVLISIANHISHDGGIAWPSVDTIARESNLSERAVQYAIRQLEILGELSVERGVGRSNTHKYSIPKVQEKVQTLHHFRSGKGANHAPKPEEKVQSTTLKGANLAPEPKASIIKSNQDALSRKFKFDSEDIFRCVDCGRMISESRAAQKQHSYVCKKAKSA